MGRADTGLTVVTVLGHDRFDAISSVEGLELSPSVAHLYEDAERNGLSPSQIRERLMIHFQSLSDR